MEFIIALADKLLWPVVAVLFLLAFRKAVSELIPLARKLKYKDFEIEFEAELDDAVEQARQAFPEREQDRRAQLLLMAKKLPNTAVLEAWAEVDIAAERCARSVEPELHLDAEVRYKQLETFLLNSSLINTRQAKLFADLRRLRNKVAHANRYEVSRAEALQYVELCLAMLEHLEGQCLVCGQKSTTPGEKN